MRRPNVLILYTDQQRWDALGAAGNPEILTPNLDRLAASGTRFSRHIVQSPICMPSRASFLSGRYPATLGITHMGVPLPETTRLLPHYLRPYGYVSANIGKLHALPHANRDHRAPHPDYGFDHLEISDEPGPYEDAYRAWVRARDPAALDAISPGLPPTAAVWQRTMGVRDGIRHPADRRPMRAVPFGADAELTHSAFVSEQTRQFIDRQGEAPWVCVAGFYSPHEPWIVPQPYLDRYDANALTLPDPAVIATADPAGQNGGPLTEAEQRSILHGYYAMVSEVDDHVGRILATLARRGLDRSTMVIFTSDHGEWLGRYGRYGKGYPADDAVSRVPLLIRPPDGLDGGRSVAPRVDTVVEAVDVLPTILDTAGIQIPPDLQGLSLRPLIDGRPDPARLERQCAISEHAGWKTLRTERFRYLVERDGSETLYDLVADPLGLTDIAADPAASPALSSCRTTLIRRLIERERPLDRTWTY